MAKMTFLQKADAMASDSFQRRFQIALQERAIYWLTIGKDQFAGMVAQHKYFVLSDGIFNNRVPTAQQRTPTQAALSFLAQYVDPNPVLGVDGTPADSVLTGASADGQFYFDAYYKNWAEVTTADETTPYVPA